ncbi:MAG: hypothetical protein Q9216_006180 [Gyalolechia sp. 2 TL-2023]
MKSTIRLLATVKSEKFLTAGNPTGLTGLLTHPAPRSQLLSLYSSTLSKLSQLPTQSVYRQSAEAITKHRISVLEAVKPAGYEEWAKRAQKHISENPEIFGEGADVAKVSVQTRLTTEKNKLETEWDGEKDIPSALEGSRMEAEEDARTRQIRRAGNQGSQLMDWENEPPLEASQIAEIEDKIGGGLIEEIIQVAEGEHQLVDIMLESRSWEELEEKPPKGQWEYFARDQHTPGTQEPPKGKN